MKKLIVLVMLIAVIVLGAQFLLPNYVEKQVEAQINKSFQVKEETIHVSATPALKLLVGNIDSLQGKLQSVSLKNGLQFQEINVDINNLGFSPFETLKNHELKITSVGEGSIEGVITEEDLSSYLQSKINGLGDTKINLENNKVNLTGHFNIGGILRGEALVNGSLQLKNNTLVFAPVNFAINHIAISGLNTSIMKDIVIYDFNEFPIKVRASRLVTDNGKLRVFLKPEGI